MRAAHPSLGRPGPSRLTTGLGLVTALVLLAAIRHPRTHPGVEPDDRPAKVDAGPARISPRPKSGFSIRDAQIMGPDGHPFVARGVNVNGARWVWRRHTVRDADIIANCWRFNAVRVNNFLFKGEAQWPQFDDNDDLDAIIKAYTSRGIVVVLEAHDRTGTYFEGPDLDRLSEWLAALAKRYRANPYVWFDAMNEPGGEGRPDASRWLATNRRIIEAVRDEGGSSNVVLVEGASWGQDAGGAGEDRVLKRNSAILAHGKELLSRSDGNPYGNVGFSIHVYEEWNGGDERLADYLDRAAKKGLALVVGEYGTDNGEDRSTVDATASLFRVATPRGVGRFAWHWNADPPNVLTDAGGAGGGWQIDDCATPHNLSWMGRLAWNDTHTTSQGSNP